MLIGSKASGVDLNLIIPSWHEATPDKIGSQEPDMICQTTGMLVLPNDTAQRAVPCTGMGSLLYGFSLTSDGIIRSRIPHLLASTVPVTHTFAPVSERTLFSLLLMTT